MMTVMIMLAPRGLSHILRPSSRTRYKQAFPLSSVCSTLSSLWLRQGCQDFRWSRTRKQNSLHDMVALAQHLKQGHLA